MIAEAAALVVRSAVLSDVIEALDCTEAVFRNFSHATNDAAAVWPDVETHRRIDVCLSGAYEALCRARQLIEGAA